MIQRGTDERFLALLGDNRRRLQRIARAFAERGDSDDLYQEMLLHLWRSLDTFGGRSSVSTWVYRVAVNTGVSYRRKAGVRQALLRDQAIDPDTLPGDIGGRDELRILEEFIASLGDLDRAIFTLYLEDLSYREMADILGISESHVGVRINHMKKRFTAAYIGA